MADPYEVEYGQPSPLHLPYLPNDSHVEAIDRSFVARERMLATLKLQRAVNRKKQQAGKGRSEREFKSGEWVFLKLQSYRQLSVESRKSIKLLPRYFGLYEIVAKVGSMAYTLRLLEDSKIHPTFHVSLLKICPYPANLPVHLLVDLEMLVEIKEPTKVLDRRMVRRKGRAVTEVLVRWQGETRDDATWELWQGLQTMFPEFAKTAHPWGQGCSEVGGGELACECYDLLPSEI